MAVDALRDMRRDVMPEVHPQSVSPSSSTGATVTCASDASSTTLPQDALARRLVDAYFRNVNRAYPFVDREKVLRDLEMAADDGDAASGSGSGATLLYLIMAIGCTTLQRAGQISSDVAAKFHVNYTEILQECFGREEDVESVQILVLLALYSFFDPNGASAWSIVGMVSRQAILLGLSRRQRPLFTNNANCLSTESHYAGYCQSA
ncbi:Rac GTPase-activating protein BCR/ABR [Sporothrix stenoceras]